MREAAIIVLFVLMSQTVLASTSIQEVSTNEMGFLTGGTEQVRIDSSGQLGIGTQTPTSLLDVNGTIEANGYTEGGSNTLSNSISGNAATANDLTCTNCIGTTEITDNYLHNNGDTATGNYTFNTNTLHIDTTNNRIGIGTTSPQQTLTIEGGDNKDTGPALTLRGIDDGQTESGRIRLVEKPNSYQGGYLHYDGNNNIFHIGVHDAISEVTADDINAISIERSNGNVGIGTTNPGTKLYLDNGITTLNRGNSQGDILRLRAENGERFTFTQNSSGPRLGIGTTNPLETLEVAGENAGDSGGNLRLSNTDTSLSEGQYVNEIQFYQSDSTGSVGEGTSNALRTISIPRIDNDNYYGTVARLGVFVSGKTSGQVNDDAPLEAMTFYPGGNVGIGTTSPGAKLDVTGGNIHIGNRTPGGTPNLYIQGETRRLYFGDNGTTSRLKIVDGQDFHISDYNGVIMTIKGDASGNVGIGTTNPSAALHVVGGAEVLEQAELDDTDTDALDVSGANSVKVLTNDGNLRIGGLSGGVEGQIVHIFKATSSNSLIIEHNEGTATEKIITSDGSDITLSTYGGVTLVYDGSIWFVISQ